MITIRILYIIIFFSLLLTKNHILYFSFKDDDGKIIKKENVKCVIQSPKGEVLDELKIKRTKKETKFKYDFSKHRKKVKLTGSNNYYNFIFKWTDNNGVPHENSLKVLRKWFEERYLARDGKSISNDFKNYDNHTRGIKLSNNGKYNSGGSKGYMFTIPLYEKKSIIRGLVENQKYDALEGVKIKLDYNLKRVLDLKDLVITNSNGQFEINAKKKKNVKISKNRNYGIILTKKGYKPLYQKIITDNIESRGISDLGTIELSENTYSKEEIICNSPRVWNKKCMECICEKENQIYYYKINKCDIECSENKQTIIIGDKVKCVDPPKLTENINKNDYEVLDNRIISLRFLDENGNGIPELEFTHNNGGSMFTDMETNEKGIATSYDEVIELCESTIYNHQWSGCGEYDRTCLLQSYMLDNEYLNDDNENDCYDSNESLIKEFKGYDIANMVYLSDDFLELESYVDTIDNIFYKNGSYSIYIDKNKIKNIANSEVFALTYKFDGNKFSLYDINYFDYDASYNENKKRSTNESNLITTNIDENFCSEELELIKKYNENCESSLDNIDMLIKILENNKCRTHNLNNNYRNYMHLVDYIYDDVMSIDEDQFLDMYYKDGPNLFEYLDLIFSNMNKLLLSSNTSTQNIPEGNSNAYISINYEKQIKFYYKYLEFLYVLDPDLYRIKFDEVNNGRKTFKYDFNKGENGFKAEDDDFDIKCDVFLKIQLSLSNYEQYSEKAGILSQNNISRNNSIVKKYERRMKWINAMYGNSNCQ